jgi:serine/threonine protein kinase
MNAQPGARRSSPPPAAPTRVGRYDLLAELGRGGMASVYLARSFGSAGFERLAAVKVLHRELCVDPDFVEMFLDEARVAARLHHPNATAIIDLGAEGTRLYMVMDYVEGDTLHAVQTAASALRRAVPLGIALRVVLDALEGLDAAHELKDTDGSTLGLIHRDVTPHNVLVGVDGAARLVDFGIARAACRTGVTTVGVVKGKVPFMAPEQIRGKAVDRRADIFAMGVTLWETMALRRCFPMREGAPLSRLANEAYRPLSEVAPQVPRGLDDVCRRALAFDPADRFPTAAAFAETLEEEFRGHVATQRELGQFMSVVAADKVRREREAVRTSAYPMPNRSIPPSSALRDISRTVAVRQSRRPDPATPVGHSLRPPLGDGLFDGEELTAVAPSRHPPSMAAKFQRPVTLPPLPERQPSSIAPAASAPTPNPANPASLYEVATQAFALQRSRPPPPMQAVERPGAFWPAAPVRPANDAARPSAVPPPPTKAAVEAPPPPPAVVEVEAPVVAQDAPVVAEAAPSLVAFEITVNSLAPPALPEPTELTVTALSLAPPALPEPVAEAPAALAVPQPRPASLRALLRRWWSMLAG